MLYINLRFIFYINYNLIYLLISIKFIILQYLIIVFCSTSLSHSKFTCQKP